MLGPSHCLLVVAVSYPGPCPYFQTGGRQRGRGGRRWRVGLRLGVCLETSACPSWPLCPSSLPRLPTSFPTIEAGNQDSPGSQGPPTPSCSASDLPVTLIRVSSSLGFDSLKALLPLCPGLGEALLWEGRIRIFEICKAAGRTLAGGCLRVGGCGIPQVPELNS